MKSNVVRALSLRMPVLRALVCIGICGALAACGGGGSSPAAAPPAPTYTVGGTVTGLSGSGLVLQNGGVDLPVNANGNFSFPTQLNSGATYSVTVKTQPTTPAQTCVPANAAGSVAGANITHVTIACTTNAYAIGGTITGLTGQGLVLQNNGAGDLNVGANGAFTFASTVPSGGTYAVTVATQPTRPVQRCTVTSGAGPVVAAAISSVAINCVPVVSRFAFAANFDDGTVSMYIADPTTGQLRHNGYVLAGANGVGLNPHSVTVDLDNRFAFVSNFGSDTVTGYRIESSGKLAVVNDGVTAASPRGVTVEPSGRFLYVANSGVDSLSGFQIDANGSLTPIAGSPFNAGTNPFAVAADAAGRFLYSANFGGSVTVFRIESNGALALVDADAGAPGTQNSIAAQSGSHALTIAPSGRFLYVANFNGGISAFSVDPVSGALTTVPGSPFAAGLSPRGVMVDPTGRFAYVANHLADTISVFGIDAASGALNLLQTLPAPPRPGGVTLEANGGFLWTASLLGHVIAAYAVDENTGLLTRLRDVAGRKQNLDLAVATGTTAVVYRPKFALLSDNFSSTVASYQIGASGSLTSVGSINAGGGNALSVTADPTGRFAYVVNTTSNTAAAFAINATTGVLTSAGAPIPTNAFPGAVAIEPSGRFAYVTAYSANTVQSYSIDATTGLLTSFGMPQPGNLTTLGMRIDPRGRFAYVLAADAATITPYSIDPQTGALTLMLGVSQATGSKPRGLAIDPTGRFVYVASDQSNNVYGYAIDAATGTLTSIGAAVPAGSAASYVEIDPTGRFAYVVNVAEDTVSIYSIHAATGALTEVLPRVATAALPTSIHIDATGRYAYVTNRNGNVIVGFERNLDTGALSRIDANPNVAGIQDFPGVGNALTTTYVIE